MTEELLYLPGTACFLEWQQIIAGTSHQPHSQRDSPALVASHSSQPPSIFVDTHLSPLGSSSEAQQTFDVK